EVTDWRRRTRAVPLESERTSTGRSKITLGMGINPVIGYRALTVSETGSRAVISLVALPIQIVAPSAEMSALAAAGIAICAVWVSLSVEYTSTRFMARLARKTCLFVES